MLEKRCEPVECFELVWIDGEKVAGLVVESVVAREQHQRGRIGRLDDDIGDHDLEFLDTPRGSCGGFCLCTQEFDFSTFSSRVQDCRGCNLP